MTKTSAKQINITHRAQLVAEALTAYDNWIANGKECDTVSITLVISAYHRANFFHQLPDDILAVAYDLAQDNMLLNEYAKAVIAEVDLRNA